ncbi:hypothetical protein [Thiocystis violacea]|uniref:hypothetical protein n=1 Tax=Thiocystis violacea TaxID=13725 RepID=UPI001907EC58|nr:hypothetical protein [Thiocystis violacea]MBK1720854.1 hypothetical protein [Thiocystis violacea]
MRILITLLLIWSSAAMAELAVIGHPGLKPIDLATLQRIYTGKVVEVDGIRVTPLNLPPGHRVREAFLRAYLDQDDAKYIGYWTVRRYVGKGTPPRELGSEAAIIQYVSKNPGAIGYIDANGLTGEFKVLYRSSP